MPYNSVLVDTYLNTPEVQAEVLKSAIEQSAVLSMARRLPNMGKSQTKLYVEDALPLAYFVSKTAGVPSKKQTTSQGWKNKYVTAEEIAVIVPVAESTLDDADIDLWAEIRPRIGEAFGRTIDNAVINGVNLPSTWMTDTAGVSASMAAGATAAGHVVVAGTGADLYDEILGEGGVWSFVEADGFEVNGSLMHTSMKARLRGLRDGGTGLPIFGATLDGNYTLGNEAVMILKNGAMSADSPLFSGDWTQLVYSMRQDLTFKLLDQGVIQDAEGDIVYNLAQQDMVALRCVMRIGVQIANPVTNLNTSEATRYPFAGLAVLAS